MASDRLEAIRENLLNCGYDEIVVAKIITEEKNKPLVEGKWERFCEWCYKNDRNPWEEHEPTLSAFFASWGEGKSAATLKKYASDIRLIWKLTSSAILGSDLVSTKIVDIAAKAVPNKAKYDSAFDIKPLLTYISEKLQDASDPKQCRLKLILLLRIVALRRSADIAAIIWGSVDLVTCQFKQTHTKSQKGKRQVITVPFEPNPKNPALCLKVAFENYIKVAEGNVNPEEENQPLIRQLNSKGPYAKNSMAAEVLRTMKEVGIDTKVFKSHSLRMSAATALIDSGMSIESVMRIGGWNSTQVFLKFYHRARRHGTANVINAIAGDQSTPPIDPIPHGADPLVQGNFSSQTAEFFETFPPVDTRTFTRQGRGTRKTDW